MKYIFRNIISLLGVFALFFLTSCDHIIMPDNDIESEHKHHSLKVVETKFSKDYKTFSVKVKVPENISFYSLTDSTKIKIKTKESNIVFAAEGNDMQPQLTHVKNIRQQELAEKKFKLLILVDLTLSDEVITKEKMAIQQMRKWFSPNNLYIAFMGHGGVTATLPLTDYVMDTYFRKSHGHKLLYRTIIEKMEEVAQWQGLEQRQKGLIVFSDGNLYQKDAPIDPKHYELQAKLLKMNWDAGYPSVEYINVGGIEAEEGEDNEAKAIMTQVTKHTHGLYFENFNWSKLLANILDTYDIDYADYQLDFLNPNNKEYIGKKNHLEINIYLGKKLLTSGCAEYKIGNIYNPVIINGMSTLQMILQGILLTILIGAIAFFILQIVVPYFSYKQFLKKYVTHYTNQSMIFNGIKVSQSCYFCKAPFEEGDEIVVKCKHVLHKGCWDENEYKCPEYGRNCKDGSHYYNANKLLDLHNSPYYMPWIIMSILTGWLGWICFLFTTHYFPNELFSNLVISIHGLQPGTLEAEMAYDNYAKHLNVLPLFGFSLNLWLAFGLSYMSIKELPFYMRLKEVVGKSIVAAIFGYLTYMLTCIVSIILNLESNNMIIDWIPWVINGFGITFIATYHTRVTLRKNLIAISCIIDIASMFAWRNLYLHSMIDSREQLLLCFIIYNIAIAASVAVVAPRSERYFLHIEGAIKPMDIALYKWMRTSPSYKVTIGKSVNSNLQMTWDFRSQIAPIQAIITQEHGRLYLSAVEKGIIIEDHPLPINQKIQLYHGKKFTIGKTLFTYIEKDK